MELLQEGSGPWCKGAAIVPFSCLLRLPVLRALLGRAFQPPAASERGQGLGACPQAGGCSSRAHLSPLHAPAVPAEQLKGQPGSVGGKSRASEQAKPAQPFHSPRPRPCARAAGLTFSGRRAEARLQLCEAETNQVLMADAGPGSPVSWVALQALGGSLGSWLAMGTRRQDPWGGRRGVSTPSGLCTPLEKRAVEEHRSLDCDALLLFPCSKKRRLVGHSRAQ